MDPVLSVGFRHARLVLGLAAAATAVAVPAALNVRVDVSSELLAPADGALRSSYDEVREDFGVTRVAAVFASDPHLFTPEKLRRLEGIGEELAALPSVRRVESLFTVVDVRRGTDGGGDAGALRIAPPLEDLPDDPVAVEQRREQVLSNPLFVGNLISPGGDALLLVLHLGKDPGGRVASEIDGILEPHAGELDALYAVGGPVVDRWILDRLRADQAVLLPVVVVVILAVLALALGSVVAAAIPVLAALVTTVIALGILQALGLPLNLFSAMLPVLVLVVGATEDVYIINQFRSRAREADDPDAAMALASGDVARAVLLAAGTTLLGFASVLLSDLPILRGFGFAALVGLSLRTAVSLLFVPACLSVARLRITGGSPSVTPLERVSRTVSRHVAERFVARPGPVVVGVALLAGGCVLLATRIDLSNDAAGLLGPDAEPVERTRSVEETISGLSTLHLVLAGEPGTFERQEVLEKVDALARRLRGVEGVGSVVSLPDALRRAALGLRGTAAGASAGAGSGGFEALLASDAAVAQLLLVVDPGDLRPLLTPDAARTRLALRVSFDGDEELRDLVAACERHAAQAVPGLACTLTGEPLITSAAAASIVRAQVVSLGGMIAALFAVVSLLFLSWKCGAMTVAVNLLSVLVLFGSMGALGVPLNVGTCMVAAVTLGMAIDDTLHLLVRFNREVRRLGDERAGIHAGLEGALAPIVATSLALISGFGVLALSSFVPVRQFGLLSAWVLAFALLVDVLVTPVLLGTVRMVTLWDVLGLEVRTALLERSDFFRGLSGWQARRVILATDLQEHPAGEPILRAGETGSRMYVVVQGSVEVSVETDGRPRALARLGPGEVFGEAGFASDVERTADVRTLEPSKLLALDPDSLAALRRFSPYLAATLLANVSRILGRRLSSTMEAVRQGDGDELPSRDLPPTSQVRPRRPGKRPRTE